MARIQYRYRTSPRREAHTLLYQDIDIVYVCDFFVFEYFKAYCVIVVSCVWPSAIGSTSHATPHRLTHSRAELSVSISTNLHVVVRENMKSL